MAFVGKPRDEQAYSRLTAMTQPEAAPSKRIGTEAPVGSVTAGPSAGKSAAEFTKSTQGSPGGIFSRQLAGANISGITSLAEQPLKREAGQEAARVGQEAMQYRKGQEQERAGMAQFKDFADETIGKIAGGGQDYETAQKILSQKAPETPELQVGDIKEFTPLQALRGGSVEGLLKREAAGPYTTGMAGLDALLFQKKGGAQQLGERGIAMRTAEQAAADALEKSATAEERQKIQDLVEQQRTGLTAGLKGGITAREKAYTEAPEGQQSRLAKAQMDLIRQYGDASNKTVAERQEFIQKQLQDAKSQARERIISNLRREVIAQQEADAQGKSGDVVLRMPSRAELEAMADADKRYQHMARTIDLNADYMQNLGKLQFGDVPQLGLQNVITPEDAAQYNRLQALLGGQQVTPTAATYKPTTYNQQEISDYLKNLLGRFTY